MNEISYIYRGESFNNIDVSPVNYQSEYFDLQIALESDVFYEIRKKNDISPYRLNESSEEELKSIKEFFNSNKTTFFFLFDDKELIGSILILRNYIHSLAINRKYQRKGYGEKLTQYAINYILKNGHQNIKLKVLEGNDPAHRLYLKLGFELLN